MERVFKREIFLNKAACRIFCVFVFVVLMGLGAFVRIPLPFTPVPVTAQTFFVILGAALLGSSLGVAVQLSYALLAVWGGMNFYLLGTTAGYIFGFILVSFFLGRFIRYSRNNPLAVLGVFCLADLIILSCGTAWLKILLGVSFTKALYIGFIPFIPGDLFKVWLAWLVYLKLNPRLKEIL
jgi:biotin transport system substrate-specific component